MHNIATKTGVLWGSFDPPTLAHKTIILRMLKLFDNCLIIVNNNIKKNYFSSLIHRINMLNEMLGKRHGKYKILVQDDTKANNYFNLKKTITGLLYIVVGVDALQAWLKFNDANSLVRYDGIYVVPRATDIHIDFSSFSKVFLMEIDSIYQNISSTKVRKQLLTRVKNPTNIGLEPQILTYIKQHNLYDLVL
jgi:cytidyltransferase-like protein